MKRTIKDSGELESGQLVYLIYKWRIALIIIGLATLLISFIFSSPYFITPLYKSTVILFPTSTNSISKALLTDKVSGDKDILEFGEDEQTERMLQVLNSNRIRDRIISKYDLMNHYEIEPGSNYRYTRLLNTYKDNINFRRTEYMAVKITVFDRDPQVAADIANDIASLVDSTINEIQKERSYEAFKIVEGEYNHLNNEIKKMQDSLRTLMNLGVHDYESQAEMINQQLAIELAKGNKQAVNRLEKKLGELAKYGGAYLTMINAIEYDIEQFSIIKAKYKEAKVDAEQILPQKFVVDKAFKAERKSYPIRWLIMTVSTFSVLIFSLFVIVVVENYNKLRLKTK